MDIALALEHYFPHGGLQRDFLAVAQACAARGHRVRVVTADWQGEVPDGLELVRLPVRGGSNHARMRRFGRALRDWSERAGPSVLAGFNRVPGLDLYYASDGCFRARLARRPVLLRGLPRYRTYLRLEQAVMAPSGARRILFLNRHQAEDYLRHYPLEKDRYRVLPPGVRRDRRPDANAAAERRRLREELGIPDDARLVLFLGSGFRVKGLDRAIRALAALPAQERARTFLLVAGDDDPAPFRRQLERAGLSGHAWFAGGRDDVPALLQAADLLLHPAYHESAGMALLEATVAGLPVLTTASCGYAEHVTSAGSGLVVPEPFEQAVLNRNLARMLAEAPGPWASAGLRYGEEASLYCLHDRVVDEIEGVASA